MSTPKSFVRTVVSGRDSFQMVAAVGKTGVSIYGILIEKDANGKTTKRERGVSSRVDSMEAATAEVEKIIEAQVRAGWARPAVKGGFRQKPDAFGLDALPAPRQVAAPAPKAEKKAPAPKKAKGAPAETPAPAETAPASV